MANPMLEFRSLRVLFITPLLPVLSASEAGGMHRRIGATLRALGTLAKTIHMVHIVPADMLKLGEPVGALDARQSEFWGCPVTVSLIARRSRRETIWSYYGAGIASAGWQKMLYPFGGARIAAEVEALMRAEPDLVFIDRLEAAIPLMNLPRSRAKIIFDLVDLYHTVAWRAIKTPSRSRARWLVAAQLPALLLAERRAVKKATASLVSSEGDRRQVRRLGFGEAVFVMPNSVAAVDNPPGVVAAQTILFLGSFHYAPNRQAAERLIMRIWPRVQSAISGSKLLIAGPGSDGFGSDMAAAEGVEYLGFVADLDALYARSRLVCCPIEVGGGTRLKLVEAAAYARPMVSTAVGAEGLDLTDGVEILLRESDTEIADACVEILTDDDICFRLGSSGRQAMLKRFETRLVERHLHDLVTWVCANSRPQVTEPAG